MLHRSEIHIRDPFVVVENGKYYMFGTTGPNKCTAENQSFLLYVSEDLEYFNPPIKVFENSPEFWGEKDFWAPEVHKYNDKYYMFASFFGNGTRGSQILVSDSLDGKYVPYSDGTITPKDWMSLDATFYVENGVSYTVFCHEWVQVGNGEIVLSQLSDDLKSVVGEPEVLFTAKDGPWVTKLQHNQREGYVTDGPFLYKASDSLLLMLWSSFSNGNYAIGIAYSKQGIHGPWHQVEKPVYCGDGGHGMIFRTLDNRLCLTIHTPNNAPEERAIFIDITDFMEDTILKLSQP